jgi:hypothetical protein
MNVHRLLLAHMPRRVMMGIVVAALSLLAFAGTARAAATVWFYPPEGWWNSYGSPSDTSFCGFSWSHSIKTYTYRSGTDLIWVDYYQHYNGWASIGGIVWGRHWLVDGHDSSNSVYTPAPPAWPITYTWTINDLDKYFNNSMSTGLAHGETRFWLFNNQFCLGISTGVYGPI